MISVVHGRWIVRPRPVVSDIGWLPIVREEAQKDGCMADVRLAGLRQRAPATEIPPGQLGADPLIRRVSDRIRAGLPADGQVQGEALDGNETTAGVGRVDPNRVPPAGWPGHHDGARGLAPTGLARQLDPP